MDEGYWNSRFQEGDTPWELPFASPTLVELSQKVKVPPPAAGVKVLVPGAGSGQDALYFAQKGYEVTVLDWSSEAIRTLKKRFEAQRLKVEVIQADFREAPSSLNGQFDLVIENTFLCSLSPKDRKKYVEVIRRLMKKKGAFFLGALFIRDLSDEEKEALQSGEIEDFGPPYFMDEKEARSLFASDFELSLLEPSPFAPEGRESFEWWAYFRGV